MIHNFEVDKTNVPGLFKIIPFYADDLRGNFIKDYSYDLFTSFGISNNLKEVFYTTSKKGVIRGMHFQRISQQPKIVRCLYGKIYDVVLDLRKNSPFFSKWISFELSGNNKYEIYIPGGCAHGYLVLEKSIVSYKCTEAFNAEYDDGILYDDPDIGIIWPYDLIGGKNKIIISEKDKKLQSFKDFCVKYNSLT